MKTSLTDIDSYKNICQLFVDNDEAFKNFRWYRGNRNYNRVLEHVPPHTGSIYLDLLLDAYPDIDLDRARKNDSVGRPEVYYYSHNGKFSPTTLRYTKVMADIYKQMDSFKIGGTVIEVGGGYGGQFRIISEFMQFDKYIIVDLDIVTKLQRKYLNYFLLRMPYFFVPEDVEKLKDDEFDFVISNFAFDELLPDTKRLYFEKIIKKSKHGYLSGRFDRKGCIGLKAFKDWTDIRRYAPDIGPEFNIITW